MEILTQITASGTETSGPYLDVIWDGDFNKPLFKS